MNGRRPATPASGEPGGRRSDGWQPIGLRRLVVRIDTRRQHRVYKKTVRESTTLHAHDERDEARIGDTVRLIESRPLSATKRWRLIEIVERAR